MEKRRYGEKMIAGKEEILKTYAIKKEVRERREEGENEKSKKGNVTRVKEMGKQKIRRKRLTGKVE